MLLRTLARRFSAQAAHKYRVGIIGTGPGGFYTAKYLLKEMEDVSLDLIDRLPTPFGLVRSGVAPDHPEVKSVQNDFEAVAGDPRVRFLGNVEVGNVISIADLRSYYHALVLAYGASSDRMMGSPGEELEGVDSARSFVNWYNGHPDFKDANFGELISDPACEDVVIIGQGNVAVDCARVLAKDVDELRKTDIADHALEALAESKVRRIHVLGRRGHVQAAFTMKELRELTRLEHAGFRVRPEELAKGLTPASQEEIEGARAKKRMNELLQKVAGSPPDGSRRREVELRFFLAPQAFLPSATDERRVGSARCVVTELQGPAGTQKAVPTDAVEEVPCGMVLRSIGYKSVPLDGVPFNEQKHVVRNVQGRVTTDGDDPVAGLYCSGWVKRGPSGIIGTNIPDAKQTVACIVQDAEEGRLPEPAHPTGLDGVRELLLSRGVEAASLVDWAGYQRIDAEETRRGSDMGRPRQKFVTVEDMLHAAQGRQT